MEGTFRLPPQRLSFKEKIKNEQKWGRECVDALSIERLDNGVEHTTKGNKSDVQRMLTNYGLYNNQVNHQDIQKVCDPLGIEDPDEFQDVIEPYNKTYNKVNVLLGEEKKRGVNFKSVLVNSKAADEFTRTKTQLMQEYLTGQVNAQIEKFKKRFQATNPAPQAQQGQEMSPEQQQEMQKAQEEYEAKQQEYVDNLLSPEEIEKYMKTNWRAASEIAADQLLQYYYKKLHIPHLRNDAFKHALISGEELLWVGVRNGEPVIEVLNPLKTFFHKSSETQFIQDGLYAGYRTRMTVADVLDRYGEDLPEKAKKDLEETYMGIRSAGIRDDLIGPEYDHKGLNLSLEWRRERGLGDNEIYGSYGTSNYDDIEVTHVEWKSQRKIGFKSYIDEDGNKQSTLVDESFKVPDSARKVRYKTENNFYKTKYLFNDAFGNECELHWGWIPEVWEGTKIAESYYVNIRPKPVQYRSMENPHKVKLGYIGVVYNNMNAPNISLMDRMKPFQYLYFIVMHKMKQMLAADAPPLISIDMSMIPKKLTTEEYLYYNKLGINFYDPLQNTEDGNPANLSGQKIIDETQRSTMNHVANYITILQNLDEQIGEVAGVTRQREGQTSQYESVTGMQSAIVQSSHITETLFALHNVVWEAGLTSLIETAQAVHKNKEVKIPYVFDDMTRGVIDLQPDTFTNADLGVFITDNIRDYEALEKMRSMSLEMIQNGYKASDVMSLYTSTSAETYRREIKALEDQREAVEQQMRQYESEQQERLMKMEIDNREDVQAHELEKIDKEGEWKLREAAMKNYFQDPSHDGDQDGIPDMIELMKHKDEVDIKLKEIELKERQLNQEAIKHEKDLLDKDKERRSKEKIAKMKPKPSSSSKK